MTIAPDALFEDLQGEIVILFRDRYFSLVDVGARVWTWIAEHHALDGLSSALLEDFEIDEATLQQDVAKLLDQMIGEGLVISET